MIILQEHTHHIFILIFKSLFFLQNRFIELEHKSELKKKYLHFFFTTHEFTISAYRKRTEYLVARQLMSQKTLKTRLFTIFHYRLIVFICIFTDILFFRTYIGVKGLTIVIQSFLILEVYVTCVG